MRGSSQLGLALKAYEETLRENAGVMGCPAGGEDLRHRRAERFGQLVERGQRGLAAGLEARELRLVMDPSSNLGARLRALRQARGLSQRDLAERTGFRQEWTQLHPFRCWPCIRALGDRSVKFAQMLLTLSLLLVDGCSAAMRHMDSMGTLPGAIFPALCQVFIEEEGYDSATSTVVLRNTRPIFNTFALRILHQAGALTPSEAEEDEARDDALQMSFHETEVSRPSPGGRCRWTVPNRPDEEYFGTRTLILELSNVTEDPFARATDSGVGVFARLSFGGASGASWYWVALERTGEAYRVSGVFTLEISDG
jgi:hypothetical protein